jgi:serine/threonine protein kinase
LKEAAIIEQYQAHPYIVGIKALFQGSGENRNSFYVQMPWYQHGSLDKWVDSNQRLKWPKVRSVLRDALFGLAHLHDNGVIHSDVNPQNILVDSLERGCLADFDISIDTKARTSAAHLNANKAMRGTQDAGTAGFDAPELVSSRQATRHTDIFAYGKTVHAVERRCEPDDGADIHGNMGRGQTAKFISALISTIPESRPSAKNATQDPFFAILKDVPTAELAIFSMLDKDGDGQLSREEYEAGFDRLDFDGDGYISKDEFSRAVAPRFSFDVLDADGDGEITATTLASAAGPDASVVAVPEIESVDSIFGTVLEIESVDFEEEEGRGGIPP